MNNGFRRFLRPSLRILMLVPVVFAALFFAASWFKPARLYSFRRSHDRLVQWGESDKESERLILWAKNGEKIDRKQYEQQAKCLIKLWHYYVRGQDGRYYSQRWSVDTSGVRSESRSMNAKTRGGWTRVAPEALTELRKPINAMPPSGDSIPLENLMVVGFHEDGVWTTRNYDKTNLSPQMDRILDILENPRLIPLVSSRPR